MKTAVLSSCAAAVLATGAWAEGSLQGIPVTLQVLTYDTPDELLFATDIVGATVTDEQEFRIGPGAEDFKLDVVPIALDISDSRVEIIYIVPSPGELYKARFNGYVLTFDSACPALLSARVDRAGTDLGLSSKRVRAEGNRLMINVSDMTYMPNGRIAVDLEVADCAAPVAPINTLSSGKKSSG